MKTIDERPTRDDDEAIERLLVHAVPRPSPDTAAAAKARTAVREDWRQVTKSRRRTRRLSLLATAATLVLAVTLVMSIWFVPVEAPVQVAAIEKSFGTIYRLGEQSEYSSADDLEVVSSGETIATSADAGAGLRWGAGGSLRLGAETEVVFVAADRIELRKGRVYYDSEPGKGGVSTLMIVTPLGDVSHVGTQFIASVDRDTLVVRVREGKVAIDGRYYDAVTEQGQQLTMTGSRAPSIVNVSGYGPGWEWIEATAPLAAMDGRTLYEFLLWVSRETGLDVRFESDDIEAIVRRESVEGDVSDAPRIALRQSLLSADLAFDIDNGVIRVRQQGN